MLQSVFGPVVVWVWGGTDGECLCRVLLKPSTSSLSGFLNAGGLSLTLFFHLFYRVWYKTQAQVVLASSLKNVKDELKTPGYTHALLAAFKNWVLRTFQKPLPHFFFFKNVNNSHRLHLLKHCNKAWSAEWLRSEFLHPTRLQRPFFCWSSLMKMS